MFERNDARTGYWLGIAALIASAALWSLNGPLIKLLSAGGLSGLSIAFYRSLLGGLVLLPLALPRLGTLRHAAPAWPVASVVLFTLMTASFVIATTLTSAANAIVLQYTSPIWVFLISPLVLGERPRSTDAAVLLIAMAGVGVICFGHGTAELPALAVALVSGFGYGALTIALRGLRRVAPVVVTCLNCIGSGVILGVVVAVGGGLALTPRLALLVAFMSIAQFTLPYVLFSWALRRVEAHRASIIVLLECVLNPLWTYLMIGERPAPATLIGGPLILCGVAAWIVTTSLRQRAALERVVGGVGRD